MPTVFQVLLQIVGNSSEQDKSLCSIGQRQTKNIQRTGFHIGLYAAQYANEQNPGRCDTAQRKEGDTNRDGVRPSKT